MKELKSNSHFEPFSQSIQLSDITYFPSKEFVDFNSRKSTYNHLLEAIKDGKNKMIGFYGTGGSGKTTLAKEVGKEVHNLKLFDKVIMVVVSKPPNEIKIQQEIAEQIGLKFHEDTPSVRAQRLSERLKSMKILIILDDVWSNLNLQEIGIPLNENCYILLTTRIQDVCDSMCCERKFELSLLEEAEAWALLKMHANITSDSLNEFDGVGRKIVDECKGLPVAIVTVGSALSGKGILEWKSALSRLQQSLPLDIDESSRGPYACLRLSYDYLPSLAKQLFLLCSMFPEDHEIHREDLIRFAKGTLEPKETMEDARSEILGSINTLLASCLLMHADEQACVKMHDLVRDVALWIAKKQHQAILVDNHAVSSMLAENESFKETKVISLWTLTNNFRLSNQLHCPTRKILLLHYPHEFVKDLGGVEELKILALTRPSFQWQRFYWWERAKWPMPQLSSLINLHTLCFRGIALGDISFLCQLKRLEMLDLRGSQFDELPVGIVDMTKLQLLDVFDCTIKRSPLEVIGRCEQLEELYFWDEKYAILENFSLSRLKRYVIYDTRFRTTFPNPPLLEYFDAHCIEELRALCIQGVTVSVLNSSTKDLILRANCLWLENCRWDFNDINFKIKHLAISCCKEKRFIVDNLSTNILQTGQVFSCLISLRLRKMNYVERVFQDSSITCSLPKLQELFINSCPALETYIFTHATVSSLPKLRKLEIYSCDKLKWLLSYSLASQCPSLEELRIWNCPKLERLTDEEDAHGDCLLHQREPLQDYLYGNQTVVTTAESSHHSRNEKLWTPFLSLKDVDIRNSGMKGTMFEVHQVKGTESIEARDKPLTLNSELCSLLLSNLEELEYIWKGPIQSVSLHRLENVKLEYCLKLRNIFSLAIVTSLPELKTLQVFFCEELEGIFCEESLENLSSFSNVCFPKLKNIDIWRCHKMKRVFSYSMASHHCPSLEKLDIRKCSELERVVDEEAAHEGDWQLPLLKLKKLYLIELPKLREIFGGGLLECPQHKNENERARAMNSELCSIYLGDLKALEYIWKGPPQSVSLHKLQDVTLRSCPKLRNVFTLPIVTSLPKLWSLTVSYCKEWEGIFCEESLKHLSSSTTNVFFPKLEKIAIIECNKVKWLFSSYSMASHHYPSLKELHIWDCFELERLVGEEATHGDWLLPLLDLDLQRLPKLREIFGGGLQCPQHKYENKRATALNSELCSISLYDLEELEYIWKGPTQSVSLHRLESVKMRKCPKLRNIFTLAIVTSLPALKTLQVDSCEELQGIFCEESLENLSFSANVCFPQLESILIWRCHKMKRVFSCSMASHHCPSLERLGIRNCSELERVVNEEAAHDGDWWQPLLKLKQLRLFELPKLREIFGGGLLECFQHKNENERARAVNSELCSIYLGDLEVLEYIWKGPTQSMSFHKLEVITLWRCQKLRNVFTLTIITSLPELRQLLVNECKELEGIFCEESLKILSSSSNVCFPKLKHIRIMKCNKVKWLFSSYCLASHCPSLESIYITYCSELEGVVKRCEGEVGDHENLFPKLKKLSLNNLPKLRDIYEGYEFNLLSGTLYVQDCPNIHNIPLLEYNASSELEIKSEN